VRLDGYGTHSKLEENISIIVTSLSQLQDNSQNQSDAGRTHKEEDLLKTIYESIANIRYLDWDIQNFVQFAKKNCSDVMAKQQELTGAISKILEDKQGDLERVRKIQFAYNEAVRRAHIEILNAV